MSHAHPQPQFSSPPITRQQREAALFKRMIVLCDKQDDIIRRQQIEIEQLRQQLAGLPQNAAPQQQHPPQAEVRPPAKPPMPQAVIPQSPRPEPSKPTPVVNHDEKLLRQPAPAAMAAASKPCLPQGFPQQDKQPAEPSPQPKPEATRPATTRHVDPDPQDRSASAAAGQALERGRQPAGRSPLPPLHPDGEIPRSHESTFDRPHPPVDQAPDSATPRVSRPPKGSNRVRELLNQYFDRVPQLSGQAQPGSRQTSLSRLSGYWPEPVDTWPRRLNN